MKRSHNNRDKIVGVVGALLLGSSMYYACMALMGMVGLSGFISVLHYTIAFLISLLFVFIAVLGAILVVRHFRDEIREARKY